MACPRCSSCQYWVLRSSNMMSQPRHECGGSSAASRQIAESRASVILSSCSCWPKYDRKFKFACSGCNLNSQRRLIQKGFCVTFTTVCWISAEAVSAYILFAIRDFYFSLSRDDKVRYAVRTVTKSEGSLSKICQKSFRISLRSELRLELRRLRFVFQYVSICEEVETVFLTAFFEVSLLAKKSN